MAFFRFDFFLIPPVLWLISWGSYFLFLILRSLRLCLNVPPFSARAESHFIRYWNAVTTDTAAGLIRLLAEAGEVRGIPLITDRHREHSEPGLRETAVERARPHAHSHISHFPSLSSALGVFVWSWPGSCLALLVQPSPGAPILIVHIPERGRSFTRPAQS